MVDLRIINPADYKPNKNNIDGLVQEKAQLQLALIHRYHVYRFNNDYTFQWLITFQPNDPDTILLVRYYKFCLFITVAS